MAAREEHIILKALQGEDISTEEQNLLELRKDEWLGYARMLQAFDTQSSEADILSPASDWKDVVERSGRQDRKKFMRKMMAAAAVLIALMGINWFVSFQKHLRKEQLIITTDAPKQYIHPQNGTEIRLEPGSRLALIGPHQLSFHGEAQFNVPKQQNPLLIYSGEVRVKVIGTRFSIKAPARSGKYQLQLDEGTLEVSLRDAHWTMHAGERFILDKSKKEGKVEQVKSVGEFLELKSMTLAEISLQLEQHFHIQIEPDPEFGEERFTVQLPAGDVNKALEILAGVSGAKLSMTDSGNYRLMK